LLDILASYPPMATPKALFFDVFGTCVDWRTTVARAGEPYGLGPAFADDWRARYQPQLETVRSGERDWTTLDVLHREALDEVLAAHGADLPAAARDELNLVWHRLDPWPDTVPGLVRLREQFIIAPVSNGNIALLVDMARHAGLPWDAILGAELARAYKPQPEAYLRSVEALGLRPGEVMMVAAHNGDLVAAGGLGLMTAFVPRPAEHGPGQTQDLEPEQDYDVVAENLIARADALTAPNRPSRC
jgi:2-haloacid dehalogenase